MRHENRYKKLRDNLKAESVFKKAEPVAWKCRECGNIHQGAEAPLVCPVCAHPQAFFELHVENY
jgi:rubrerythrin